MFIFYNTRLISSYILDIFSCYYLICRFFSVESTIWTIYYLKNQTGNVNRKFIWITGPFGSTDLQFTTFRKEKKTIFDMLYLCLFFLFFLSYTFVLSMCFGNILTRKTKLYRINWNHYFNLNSRIYENSKSREQNKSISKS